MGICQAAGCGNSLTGRQKKWCSAQCKSSERREYKAQYYATNRERLCEAQRRRRAANPEYDKEYHAANRERRCAAKRIHYAANREQYHQSARAWRKANTKRAREINKAWYKANPEWGREKNKARYHALGGDGYRRQYRRLYLEQGGYCAICGEAMPYDDGQVDHKVPRILLEAHNITADIINDPTNLQAVHSICNYSKRDALLPEHAPLFESLLSKAGQAGVVQASLFSW